MRFSKLAVAVTFGMAFASAGLPAIEAADVERDVKPSAEQTLMVWGGAMDVAWFDGPMGLLGLTVERTPNVKANSHRPQFDTLGLQQSAGLQIRVAGLDFVGFAGGQLQANGGYVLKATGGLFPHDIDLRNFTLRPRKDNPLQLDVVSADGKAWFYIDRMMYKIEGGSSPRMIVRAMDLRVSAEAAAAAGRPGIADYVVAALEMGSKIASDSVVLPSPKGSSKWPGTAAPNGGTYEADVFMQTFTGQWMLASGEDGPGGADGIVVYTPSSTLRNNRANGTSTVTIPSDPLGTSTAPWAADVVWNTKFTSPTAPYNNDQHPYLVWNLYRTNADGSIEQIGQSGVKHAFLTINVSCDENPGNGHILGRGCSDTYATTIRPVIWARATRSFQRRDSGVVVVRCMTRIATMRWTAEHPVSIPRTPVVPRWVSACVCAKVTSTPRSTPAPVSGLSHGTSFARTSASTTPWPADP